MCLVKTKGVNKQDEKEDGKVTDRNSGGLEWRLPAEVPVPPMMSLWSCGALTPGLGQGCIWALAGLAGTLNAWLEGGRKWMHPTKWADLIG